MMPHKGEDPMETQEEVLKAQPASVDVPKSTCAHSRLIDDVRTSGGKRTGKVRCLECFAVFNDPYEGLK